MAEKDKSKAGKNKFDRRLILTVPPYANFQEFSRNALVEGVRLNTTLPLQEKSSLEELLFSVKEKAFGKSVWVDLKCRQLRIADYNVKFLVDSEIHYIDLNHEIVLDVSQENQKTVLLDNGNIAANISELINNGRTLVVKSSTERRKGLPLPQQGEVGIRNGMSVTILDPSLVVKGYLTDKDKEYIRAAKKTGIHNYMLSFVEDKNDFFEVLNLDNEAKFIAKIESEKGLGFVSNEFLRMRKSSLFKGRINLMTARGDLYLQLESPDRILDACEQIISADPQAIFASRLLESFKNPDDTPKCSDIFDLTCGMYMGYKRFMLGDDVCAKRDSVNSAINFFGVLNNKYLC